MFFTNGGAEATENAARLARLHTGRQKVLTTYRSYHGATGGAITYTGEPRRWGSEPGWPGVVHFFGPYRYRSAFHATTDTEECERALEHLATVVMMENPSSIAAIMLETVVGTNGVLVPPDGYLEGVRELCDRHGILFIADEVMSGFGRCGEWFAVQRWNVTPDLIAFAKGVNSGYVPLGGVIMSDAIAATFQTRAYPGGLTYSGHPLACAAAVASIETFEDEKLLERSRHLGDDVLGPGLRTLAEQHPSVGEVRGLGCFWAVELVRVARHARAPRAVQRRRPRQRADGRGDRRVPCRGRVAGHPLQPSARDPAARDLRRRRPPRHRPPRRRPHRRGRLLHRLTRHARGHERCAVVLRCRLEATTQYHESAKAPRSAFEAEGAVRDDVLLHFGGAGADRGVALPHVVAGPAAAVDGTGRTLEQRAGGTEHVERELREPQ